MANPTAYYVDPAINANSGTGTSVDPFGDLQYALNTITRDATNGDIIHIKAGTAEVLAAALTLATYGAPAEGAPLIFEGYTATAGDGGVAEINCNGVTMFAANNYAALNLIDLQIHSFGNNNGIALSGTSVGPTIVRCNIHKGGSAPSLKTLIAIINGRIIGSYIHDAGTNGTGASGFNQALYNYIYNCPIGLTLNSAGGVALGNIIVNGASAGISLTSDHCAVINNTIYSSTAATGNGIQNSAGNSMAIIINNMIEGYSGTGGKAINTSAADVSVIGYNAYYNNEAAESFGDVYLNLAHTQALGASPFTNKLGGDFSVSTALKALAWPAVFNSLSTNNYLDIGAAQRQEPAGGAVSISPTLGSVGAA